MKKLLTLVIYLVSIFTFKATVVASSEFSTDFRSTYTITTLGVTKVSHDIKIVNNLSHIYTTEYTLQIGSPKLENVIATSAGSQLPLKIEKENNTTTIKIKITHPQIGLGATTELIISYDTTDLAEQIGTNWEINIPRLAKANEASFYSRKIIVPSSFGEPSTITPRPTTISTTDDSNIYEFVGYTRESISLLFGKTATYELNLTYRLKNSSLSTADTEAALPPDTAYQKVVLASLDPPPKTINLDVDGNWLAIYTLKPQEEKVVKANLFITVSPTPIYALSQKLNPDTLKPESKYWQKTSSVTALSAKLASPKDIYNYLVENFVYDYRLVGVNERLGVAKALDNPDSVICTEFTDTFIALARSNNIHSQEINGYTYTSNRITKPAGDGDILHAWPAYYDKSSETWIQLDPTWGNTTGGVDYFSKLDFSHLTFVIHGKESEYPLPAGAYKNSPEEKTIEVKLNDNPPLANPTYKLSNLDNQLIVTNTGNAAINNQVITYQGQSYQLDYLPPYGTHSFTLQTKDNFLIKLLTWLKGIIN